MGEFLGGTTTERGITTAAAFFEYQTDPRNQICILNAILLWSKNPRTRSITMNWIVDWWRGGQWGDNNGDDTIHDFRVLIGAIPLDVVIRSSILGNVHRNRLNGHKSMSTIRTIQATGSDLKSKLIAAIYLPGNPFFEWTKFVSGIESSFAV